MSTGADLVKVFFEMGDFAAGSPPYSISEGMLRALLNADGKPYPSVEKLKKLAETKQLGSIILFVDGMDKFGKAGNAGNPPPEIFLFLTSVYCSLSEKDEMAVENKNIRDKLAVFACHTIAERWPKLGYLCSGLSSRVIHGNESMKQAVRDECQRSGERLMFSGAVIGSSIRLALKFGKRLPKINPTEQIAYLLNESPGDPEDRRRLLAVAWACNLLKNEKFASKGGLDKTLDAFRADPRATVMFLNAYLAQTCEANATRQAAA